MCVCACARKRASACERASERKRETERARQADNKTETSNPLLSLQLDMSLKHEQSVLTNLHRQLFMHPNPSFRPSSISLIQISFEEGLDHFLSRNMSFRAAVKRQFLPS